MTMKSNILKFLLFINLNYTIALKIPTTHLINRRKMSRVMDDIVTDTTFLNSVTNFKDFDVDLQPIKRPPKGSTPEYIIEGDDVEDTPLQQFIVSLHFLLVGFNILRAALSISSWGLFEMLYIPIVAYLSVLIGDFGTGVFHWSVDNYGDIKTPIFGPICVAFQGHHQTPWTITFRSFANNVHKIAIATIPFLLLLSYAANGHPYIQLFFSLFINWWLVSQELHKYSHMKQLPRFVKFLQDKGIILSRKEHGLHHNAPYEGHYCILTGSCNSFLDKIKFFRKLEKIVYNITGYEPITWQNIELKRQALYE